MSAKNTSKKCHKCGKVGKRERKSFTCPRKKCGWKGDADLNAARNVALRGIKIYHSYLAKQERDRVKKAQKEKDKLHKLHASEDGFREVEQSATTSK